MRKRFQIYTKYANKGFANVHILMYLSPRTWQVSRS